MNKATIDRLVDTGFKWFPDDFVFVKDYVDPVIGKYGTHGLSAAIYQKTGEISIMVFAPSGRIVDYVDNQSGVTRIETSDDVIRLDRWIEQNKERALS